MQNNNKSLPSILTSPDFVAFLEQRKLQNWDIFILFHKLQKFLYSHNLTKAQVLEIFAFFKFDKTDALDIYVKKCFYSTRIKMGNFKKFKDSFTIYMIIFDHLHNKDIIDFHYKLNTNSTIKEYYDFISKVTIYKGWNGLLFVELIGKHFSFDVLYHATHQKKFFVKVGVFSADVKELLIKIITVKDVYEDDSLIELDLLIKELQFMANISAIHIFEILSSTIIFIVDLDSSLYENSLKNSISIDYIANNPDTNIDDFNRLEKAYQDNFKEDFEYYKKDYANFVNKHYLFETEKKPTLRDKIKNFLSKTFFTNDNITKDKYQLNKERTFSIDSPDKEKIYFIYYHFQDNAKLDFFNLIISKYNNRLFKNKNKFHHILKNPKEYDIKPYSSKYEKYIEGDDESYIYFDLEQEDKKEVYRKLKEEHQESINKTEKNLLSLKNERFDDVIESVIFDSFSYLKFFFEYFKDCELTSDEICLLFNSKKYNSKK